MKYVTLEEAFAVPGQDQHQPLSELKMRIKPNLVAEFRDRLVDFKGPRLSEMDAHGIEIQVLSLTVPGIQAEPDPRRAVDYAVASNDFLGEVIAENPSRYRGFAALPMQDPTAAIEELHRCIDELGFVGAMVNGRTQGHYLDEPMYEEFWGELETIDRPLYIHPGAHFDAWPVMAGYPEMFGSWSWAVETGGHALRLVYGGVFDRHPNAHIILGHMGEFLPFQRCRLDSRYLTTEHDKPLQRMPSEYIGTNILITNSGVFSPAALAGAVAEIGADAVMFSVDYPYEYTADAIRGFEKTELSDVDRAKIAYQNAERILKL